MKYSKDNDWDREKKIHKVTKSNKAAKHKKMAYNIYEEESDDDFSFDEQFPDEVTNSKTYKY